MPRAGPAPRRSCAGLRTLGLTRLLGRDELAEPRGDRVDTALERRAVGGFDGAEQVGR